MNTEHPNITLLKRLNPGSPEGDLELLADDVVFHYFNPELPDIHGGYFGKEGFKRFFESLGSKTGGTFRVNPVSAQAMGDELVVVHTINSMSIDGHQIETDAVTVWRFVDGLVTEIWDIPSLHSLSIS